jgi:hypothetical protein
MDGIRTPADGTCFRGKEETLLVVSVRGTNALHTFELFVTRIINVIRRSVARLEDALMFIPVYTFAFIVDKEGGRSLLSSDAEHTTINAILPWWMMDDSDVMFRGFAKSIRSGAKIIILSESRC